MFNLLLLAREKEASILTYEKFSSVVDGLLSRSIEFESNKTSVLVWGNEHFFQYEKSLAQ